MLTEVILILVLSSPSSSEHPQIIVKEYRQESIENCE